MTPPSLVTGSGIHCDAVRAAYRVWVAASAFAEPLAFEAYQSALDRGERAAKTYAGLMRRVRHLTETGPAHQLALIQAPPGACYSDDHRRATSTAEACHRRRFEPAHSVRSFGRREPRRTPGWDVRGALRAGHHARLSGRHLCQRAQRRIRRIAAPVPQTARELGRVWRSLQWEDVFPVSMSALVGGVCGRRDHLVPERELQRLIRRHIEFGDLADAAIPLHLVAFDLLEGRELRLSTGSAVDALAASASIPGIFRPVAIGEQRLIDGGVVNNTPISHAVELGAEHICVLPTQEPHSRPARVPTGAREAAIHGLHLLVGCRLEADLARYSTEAELILLRPRTRGAYSPRASSTPTA